MGKPISHIIKRKLDRRIRQDACTSWGTGGFLVELQFWWQIKWSDLHPSLPDLIKRNKISINVLKLVGVVINYYASALAFFLKPTKGNWQPKVLCEGDNTTSTSWYEKFSNPQPQARRLTRLLRIGQ